VAVLGVVAAVALLGRDGEPGDGAGGAAGATAARTALVSFEDGGAVVAACVLSVTDDATAGLLVPSRLLVDVAGGGRVPLAEAAALGAGAPGKAVADALDLRVDGTWVLARDDLAGLVDSVGGVVVDVDTEVRADEVAVAAGPGQRLTGTQAVAFSATLGEQEAEAGRLARFDQVLAGLLRGLPVTGGEVQTVLTRAGAADSTLPAGDLSSLLAAAAEHARAGTYGASVLPVTEISAGGDEVLYGLDADAAADVVRSRFAEARRQGAGEAPRVLVQNGVGTPGLADRARDRLVAAGFRFVGGGNASTLGRQESAVLVPRDGRDQRELATAVAEALGLPETAIAVGREAPTTADVVVVLGADFAATEPTSP
jgi:hypothetical protein